VEKLSQKQIGPGEREGKKEKREGSIDNYFSDRHMDANKTNLIICQRKNLTLLKCTRTLFLASTCTAVVPPYSISTDWGSYR